MTAYATNRWRGIVAVALATFGIGLLSTEPALILLAAVAVGLASYPRLVYDPPVPTIEIERHITPEETKPGEPVTVNLSVRNTGDRTIPDLRIIDGVPPLAEVVNGSPRLATTLRPNSAASLEYEVVVEPGVHRFSPSTAITRDVSGAMERITQFETNSVIDCPERGTHVPLSAVVSFRPGAIPANHPGTGVEFYGTREATPSDSIDRIDWRQFARTGELISVEYRPERSTNAVLWLDPAGFDGRGSSFLSVRCLTAAERFTSVLEADNHAVGLLAPGRDELWIPPGIGHSHAKRIRNALDEAPAFMPPPINDDGNTWSPSAEHTERSHHHNGRDSVNNRDAERHSQLNRTERIGPHDQVLLISPLLDDEMVDLALTIDEPSSGRVTVICPEPPTDETIGPRLQRIGRKSRIRALRSREVRVFEWGADESLVTAAESWMEAES